MKTLTTIAIFFAMISVANAQAFNQEKTDVIVKNYVHNLASDSDQLAFSTIVQVIRLKAAHPEFPMQQIQSALMEKANYASQDLAYYAFLAARLISQPHIDADYIEMNEENAYTYLAKFALEMNRNSFASK